MLAGSTGIWLFYVQHQFDDTYWERTDEWSFNDAAVRGSSHLALPKVLQFFSGNIGFHHVHHLNPKIPNYNLQRAHEEQPMFRPVPAVTLHRRPARHHPQAVGRRLPAHAHLEAGPRRQLTAARCSSVANHPPSRRAVGAATVLAAPPSRKPTLSRYSAGAESASSPRAS